MTCLVSSLPGFLRRRGQVGDVDGLVAEEDALFAVDGDDEALLGDFADGFGLGDGDFDAGLQHRRGDHEDDQQHEHDVDQRGDVDLREGGLGVAVAGCEGHGATFLRGRERSAPGRER